MTDPDASVIIIVRNGAATIRRQLDALARQVDAPAFEVIVVDNGSSDGTPEVVRGWITEGIGAATTARLVFATDRASIPYARNTGARSARGRLLLWCDADDMVHPGWVVAMCHGNHKGMACGRIIPWREGSAAPGLMPEGLVTTEYLPHVPGCNFSIDRRLFFDLGAFDESLPRYGCEDVDISWRAQEAGHQIGFLPDALIDFTVTPSSRAVKKTFLAARARLALSIRHPHSLQGRRLSLTPLLGDCARQTVQLPVRLLRPGQTPRTRWVRTVVASYGRLSGYVTYGILKKPPRYLGDTV